MGSEQWSFPNRLRKGRISHKFCNNLFKECKKILAWQNSVPQINVEIQCQYIILFSRKSKYSKHAKKSI